MIRVLRVSVLSLGVLLASVGVFAQTMPSTIRKGTIKSITDVVVVVVPNDNKKVEVAYDLTAATKKSGALVPGGAIAVTYHVDNAKSVATVLEGKSGK